MKNYTMQQLNTLSLLLRWLTGLTQLVEEANAKLKKKLVGFDGKVDWRVVADARVKGGLIIEEIEKEPAS